MHKNKVKAKIRQGKLAIGTYVTLADPALIEIIGAAGFDAAFIDMEHSAFDLGLVQEMIRACDLVDITSLVRVSDNNPKTILRILDMGAQGIQVPHIGSKEDALEMVKAVRYAPLGERGIGGSTRATRYGAVPLNEHFETSNAEILLAVMVEDIKSVKQLEAIASIDGLDLIAIGTSDLAQSLGISNSSDRRLKSTIDMIAATLKRVGKAKMTLPLNNATFPLNATELQRMGVAYANCGPPDVKRLLRSYQVQIQEIERQLAL
jgi:2-keto-3-deoxy-L-rhamnonate aldolase RhmA